MIKVMAAVSGHAEVNTVYDSMMGKCLQHSNVLQSHMCRCAKAAVAPFWRQVSSVQVSFDSNTLPAALKAVSC